MTRPARWLFGIALGLFFCGAVAVAAVFLERDAIFRKVLINRMRAATGMQVKVDSVHVGLISPTVTIAGLKLYNTAAFGGTLCLDMPKLELKYDPTAVRSGLIHLPEVRLNLAELDLVTDKNGRSNFDTVQKQDQPQESHPNSANRFTFGGIGTLKLTMGKFHTSNLRAGTEMEVDFDMKDQVFHNVKSDADLPGISALLSMRGSSSVGGSGIDFDKLFNALITR